MLSDFLSGLEGVLARVERDAPQAEQVVGVVAGVLVDLIHSAEVVSPAAAQPAEETIAAALQKVEDALRAKVAGIEATAVDATAPDGSPAPPAPVAGAAPAGRNLTDADVAALAAALKAEGA